MIRYVLNTLGSFRPALAVGVGIPFLVAASTNAQAPKPTPAAEATTERVIVTGSYIPTAETESALPVTVYTAEVMHKQGANTPAESLRQLPSFVGNTLTENDSNGGDGSAFINLRGIGPENVLTLINGRRAFSFANINAISIGAISRTEILKDGASAIYGSDAVAGVVNFVLINGPGEKPYEGAELFALYGNTTDSDAHVRQVYLRGGVTGLDGKVAIAVAGEYYSRANLFSRDREISTTADTSNATGLGWGGFNNNSTLFPGRLNSLVLINPANNAPRGLQDYRPFDANNDPGKFNFRTFTPAIPAQEKAMYYVTGRYKVFGDGMQLYGDIMYSKTKQDNGLAPSPFTMPQPRYRNPSLGIFNGRDATGHFDGSPDNSIVAQVNILRNSPFSPFLAGTVANVAYRFIQELGDRRSFFDQDYYRYVAGVNGDFNFKDNGFISHFGYDSGFVYERFDDEATAKGDASRGLLYQQITAGIFNPFIGPSALPQGTVPIYNTSNPAAPHYRDGVSIGTGAYDNITGARNASYLGHNFNYERDWLVDAKINAHLFPNLWNGGVDFALGYEHRETRTHQVGDPVQVSGDQLGFNASTNFKHKQEVDSVFTEVTVPIVTSTMNVPFVRSFDLAAAWRYEKFNDEDSFHKTSSTFDNPNPDEDFGGTPRLSLRYQPIADITLRASWGQSFRSPTPFDQFSEEQQNFPLLFDPYKRQTLQPPNGVFQTGNPTLQPEKTDSYSAGVVWTPKFLPGFTMTVDFYQLFTRDVILNAADFAQLELTLNGNDLLAGVNPPRFADVVHRSPVTVPPTSANNRLLSIDSSPHNAGKRLVEGLDVTAVYEIPTERFGKFTLSGSYNHFFIWKAQPIDGQPSTSFLGNYNNGSKPLAPGAIPWNKGYIRGEWEWRHFDFVATGNYIGDYRDDPSFFDTFVGVRTAPSYITLDMQLSYEWVKPEAQAPTYAKDAKDGKNVMQTAAETSSIWQRMLWGTTLSVGVNDAFDRQPPSLLGAFNDNYDTSLYTLRNRYWYVSMKKKF